LNEKQFDKKEMAIQCPYEANTCDDDDGETETKKLYSNFVDKMGKEEITILYAKPGNTNQ